MQPTMLIVKTNEGLVFTGTDAKDIVRQMRNTQWGDPLPKGEYIQSVIFRVCNLIGEEIPENWDDIGAEGFLLFLESHGLVTIGESQEAQALPP